MTAFFIIEERHHTRQKHLSNAPLLANMNVRGENNGKNDAATATRSRRIHRAV